MAERKKEDNGNCFNIYVIWRNNVEWLNEDFHDRCSLT